MIRISQLKLPITHCEADLKAKAAKALKISSGDIASLTVVRQSVDARKKDKILYIYTVDVKVKLGNEKAVLNRAKGPYISIAPQETYVFPEKGTKRLSHSPVIVGTGPCGLFAGLFLAREGYCPILLERGADGKTRREKVASFWAGGALDENTNVQFGEGGAGTFSDGKLNTLVKDRMGRNKKVLETLAEFGADSAIIYQNKPHIGTDVLSGVVERIREEIIRLGGQVRFLSCVTDFLTEPGRVKGVMINGTEKLDAQVIILAAGHSARDTFQTLWDRGVPMESKSFAVGLRIQHPQRMIDISQYGELKADILGAASYKLTHQASGGRGVYSFCMCPGGYVVDASSELGRLAVNGMSYHSRDGENANSAIIVTVTPDDFPDRTPMGAIAYQRRLEELAYKSGNGRVPVQLFGDFRDGKETLRLGDVNPQIKGEYAFADLRRILPPGLAAPLSEGVTSFGKMIKGFDRYDAILAGVESRTSSPIRINRDESYESQMKGLFPCGEGAGYAGGITSAAMDGIRVAEEIARRFAPLVFIDEKGKMM